MSTFVRSTEAARILGVSPATLYAYVSRGRVHRRVAADGRASLFDRDELEALAARSRRTGESPRPTIDVQITSAITTLSETGVEVFGHPLPDLARQHRFETVAELLWSAHLPPAEVDWPAPDPTVETEVRSFTSAAALTPIGRLTATALLLDARYPTDDPATAARRLLTLAPAALGAPRRDGTFAERLAAAWIPEARPEVVGALDAALILLSDHELATSTLAARVAASVRTTPYGAIDAGLAALQGALHGSASAAAHRLLADCAEAGAPTAIAALRAERRPVPGLGHKVYRGTDPRFDPLLDRVRPLATREQMATIDDLLAVTGRTLPVQPNIDLALGALTWVAGLDPGVPIFAVARIAGWGAHIAEEFGAPPVRYRGLARRP